MIVSVDTSDGTFLYQCMGMRACTCGNGRRCCGTAGRPDGGAAAAAAPHILVCMRIIVNAGAGAIADAVLQLAKHLGGHHALLKVSRRRGSDHLSTKGSGLRAGAGAGAGAVGQPAGQRGRRLGGGGGGDGGGGLDERSRAAAAGAGAAAALLPGPQPHPVRLRQAAGGHLCLYSGVVISNTEPGTAATLLPDRNLIQYDCGKLQVGTFACTVGLLSRTLSQVQRQRFCQTATSSSAAAAAVASVPSSATAAGCAAPMASFPSSATAAGCASLLTSYPSDSATAA